MIQVQNELVWLSILFWLCPIRGVKTHHLALCFSFASTQFYDVETKINDFFDWDNWKGGGLLLLNYLYEAPLNKSQATVSNLRALVTKTCFNKNNQRMNRSSELTADMSTLTGKKKNQDVLTNQLN